MSEYCVVYTTFANKDDAVRVIKTLISEKLIACGNIVDNMTAIYSWKGNVEQASEVVVFIKTKTSLYSEVENRIKALHAYEVPCIFMMNIEKALAPYVQWINEETKS